MRGNDISVRLAARDTYHPGNDIGVRALGAVAVTSQNRSVTAQFDLKSYRQFRLPAFRYQTSLFASERLCGSDQGDDTDVIAGAVVGAQVVPESRNHFELGQTGRRAIPHHWQAAS